MDWWLWIVQLLVVLVVLFYFYVQRKYSYWTNRGVTGPKPHFWAFGNISEEIWYSPDMIMLENLKEFGKVYGAYRGLEPKLVISDVRLIKQIMIKDFHVFVNRIKLNTYEEYWNENLFNSRDDKWKRIRTITSPSFTSGKLKGMHKLMSHCVHKLVTFLDTKATSGDGVLNVKEVISGFTVDVIASTGFATETDANDDRSKQSAFVRNAIDLFQFSASRLLFYLAFPRVINDLVKVKHQFNDGPFDFFKDLTREIVRKRKSEKIERKEDLVQLMMDAFVTEEELKDMDYDKLTANDDTNEDVPKERTTNKSSIKKTLTENEIIGQCIIFFTAGFETTASTISHCLLELAQAPEVQNRLFNDLENALTGLDEHSELYYETVITGIPYLEAVVKETLRKNPPLVRLTRRVGIDGYKLDGIPLSKDLLIDIPTYAVHHNAEYYPEPQLFKPDRFMPENKSTLNQYAYLPFGIGPRNCIGMRFAYQEIKLCLALICRQFKFTTTAATPNRLKFKAALVMLSSLAFELKVVKR